MRGLCRNLLAAPRISTGREFHIYSSNNTHLLSAWQPPSPRHVHGCDQRYPASRGGGGVITHVDGHQGVGARAACLDPFWLIHPG